MSSYKNRSQKKSEAALKKKQKDKKDAATESQMPCESNSEGLTDKALQKQDETSKMDDPRHDNVEQKRKALERDTDDEEKRRMGHSDVVTWPPRPPNGLYNQGATCYLNSVLQVLFKTTEIHDRLDPQSNTDLQLRNIFEELKKTTCGTETFTSTFGVENVFQQCDAAECLETILRKISQQASEAFQGELRYTTKCSKGHSINEETNPFWTLPLSLKDAHDTTLCVEESLLRIFQEKLLTGDNKVYCKACNNKTEATRGCEMVKSPQILTLLLKRFDFVCADVPLTLQMKNKTYKLYGMVNHMGKGGLYTATILSNEHQTWYECNNTYVKKAEEQPFAETMTYRSKTAHLLMYRATESQMPCESNSEGLTDKALQKQDETSKMDDPRHDNVEQKRKALERDTDDEEKRRMGHSDVVARPPRPPNGLYNQGATCYLNSVLQVLFKTTEIHDRLDPQSNTDLQLRNIFEKLKRTTCRTETFTSTFGVENVFQQCDAAECLETILRKISQQASEAFQGELRYTTKCSKGHSINEETNPFWTLPLSLKDAHDTTLCVEESLLRIFQEKLFTGDNKVYCKECNNKTEATSGCEMVKSPQILTLLLKRFDFDYNTMSHVKSHCYVDVPHALRIMNKTYKLYGMVNHMGSLRGGHYTATILSNDDQTWYECNDSYVNKVKEQPCAETRTYTSRTVYLLMYRATESQMPCESNSEGLTDKALQKQDETSKMDDPRHDNVEQKRKALERDADDEEKRRMGHSDVVTQPPRPPNGLYNQRGMHYLNSVLQVLFMTTEIHDRLDPQLNTDLQLRNIFEELKKTTCGTETFTSTFGVENVFQQCDAAECLETILRKISQQASEAFQGELRYTTKCSKGHSINEETNPFWTLPLSLKDAHDTTLCVEESLLRIFQAKLLTGDNKVYCKECNNKTEATRGCEMVKSPQILTLLLKRFDFDYNTMSHVKSHCYVDVPCILQTKNKTYKLYGMVNHMGSLRGGHYTATILSNEDQTWYEFDDAYVIKADRQPFAKKTYNSSTAYLLMYRVSQTTCETHSEGLTGKAKERQAKISNLNEQGKDKVQQKVDSDTDEEEQGLTIEPGVKRGDRGRDLKDSKQHPDKNKRAKKNKLRKRKDTKKNKPRNNRHRRSNGIKKRQRGTLCNPAGLQLASRMTHLKMF
ncbi:uncharacterized protein [Enoplosus armatus]|uniref:uncharacterized protein n=1 Tax=Enoplosus armatus TaxID=215367 RepID=UPI003994DAF6